MAAQQKGAPIALKYGIQPNTTTRTFEYDDEVKILMPSFFNMATIQYRLASLFSHMKSRWVKMKYGRCRRTDSMSTKKW